jgi:hypothetical protein
MKLRKFYRKISAKLEAIEFIFEGGTAGSAE